MIADFECHFGGRSFNKFHPFNYSTFNRLLGSYRLVRLCSVYSAPFHPNPSSTTVAVLDGSDSSTVEEVLLRRSSSSGQRIGILASCSVQRGQINLNEEQVNSYVNLLIGLEGHFKTSGTQRFYSGAALISRLDPFQQSQLVLSLEEMPEIWSVNFVANFSSRRVKTYSSLIFTRTRSSLL